MKAIKIKTYVIASILLSSGALCVYSIYLSEERLIGGSGLYRSWGLIFSVLIAVWTIEDMKVRGEHPSLGHGFAAFIFWPLFLLWQLLKSRGIEGIVIYLGFWALYSLANVLNMAFYFVK